MRAEIFTPFFRPVQGGVENATLQLARELKNLCSIAVHTFSAIGEEGLPLWRYHRVSLPNREVMDGIEVQRHPFLYLPVLKFFSPSLLAAIRRSTAEVVHVQGFSTIFNNMLLQRLAGNKALVLTVHGLHEGITKINLARARAIVIPAIRSYLKDFDAVIASSERDRSLLRTLGCSPHTTVTIPNGVDRQKFESSREFMIRDGKKSILCVARFDTNKGHEDLIRAQAIVKDAGLDCRAYLVGRATDERYLRKIQRLVRDMELTEDVQICSPIDDAELADCYMTSDVFVLPSRQETSPLAILEAMYAGLPIIATNVGGIPELVSDGIHGYLVDPERPDQLAQKIAILLTDDTARRRFRQRNVREAERFTWRAAAERTFSLYEEVLSRRRRII